MNIGFRIILILEMLALLFIGLTAEMLLLLNMGEIILCRIPITETIITYVTVEAAVLLSARTVEDKLLKCVNGERDP